MYHCITVLLYYLFCVQWEWDIYTCIEVSTTIQPYPCSFSISDSFVSKQKSYNSWRLLEVELSLYPHVCALLNWIFKTVFGKQRKIPLKKGVTQILVLLKSPSFFFWFWAGGTFPIAKAGHPWPIYETEPRKDSFFERRMVLATQKSYGFCWRYVFFLMEISYSIIDRLLSQQFFLGFWSTSVSPVWLSKLVLNIWLKVGSL